jgi:hypothetical protein
MSINPDVFYNRLIDDVLLISNTVNTRISGIQLSRIPGYPESIFGPALFEVLTLSQLDLTS